MKHSAAENECLLRMYKPERKQNCLNYIRRLALKKQGPHCPVHGGGETVVVEGMTMEGKTTRYLLHSEDGVVDSLVEEREPSRRQGFYEGGMMLVERDGESPKFLHMF